VIHDACEKQPGRRSARPSCRWWRSQFLLLLARLWRPLLFRTTFIGITGSVGKSTCKECLAAILSAHFPTAKTLFNQNEHDGVPRTILRVRPWHRFAWSRSRPTTPDWSAGRRACCDPIFQSCSRSPERIRKPSRRWTISRRKRRSFSKRNRLEELRSSMGTIRECVQWRRIAGPG